MLISVTGGGLSSRKSFASILWSHCILPKILCVFREAFQFKLKYSLAFSVAWSVTKLCKDRAQFFQNWNFLRNLCRLVSCSLLLNQKRLPQLCMNSELIIQNWENKDHSIRFQSYHKMAMVKNILYIMVIKIFLLFCWALKIEN